MKSSVRNALCALILGAGVSCTQGSQQAPDTRSDGGINNAQGQAAMQPTFYFVLHADPNANIVGQWNNLVTFMTNLEGFSDALPRSVNARHHVTIMFSPQWGPHIEADMGRIQMVNQWIRQGHEMAFHSHTINHSKQDGWSQESGWADRENGFCAADCTLDDGLEGVQSALNAAASVGGAMMEYDIKWARIGPTENGGRLCDASGCSSPAGAGSRVGVNPPLPHTPRPPPAASPPPARATSRTDITAR